MTLPIATYRAAIKTWVEAQSGCTAQWRDNAGAWQSKPRIRMHLQSSAARGVDWLTWEVDDGLPDTAPYVPTVHGLRALTLSLLAETRDQSGNTTAMYYLEKIRSSVKKPSVRSGLYAAGLVIESCETLIDLEGVRDGRIESRASLDVHLSAVVNDRDEAEAESYVDHYTATGGLLIPDGTDAGPGEEEYS